MRIELNLETGEQTEHEDAPVTWVEPIPTYSELRALAYAPLSEQLDMQYWDAMNNTETWLDHIRSVKEAHPKEGE
tara:strand:- start:209 stop:433 length:225 start_codon:yes stop_codon:yes gene_type:complete